jgi:hypothetical protein
MRSTLLRRLLGRVAAGGLAVLAVSATLIEPLVWPGIALAAAVLVLCAALDRPGSLASKRVPRALAVAAFAAAGATAAPQSAALPLIAAAAVALGLITYEPLVAKALAASRLESVHLEVRRDAASRWFTPRTARAAILGLTAATGASSALVVAFDASWPAWPVLAGGIAVAGGLAAGVLSAWRRRRQTVHGVDAAVHTAMHALAPRFLVHLAGPTESDFHLLMWLEYFDRIGDPYAIVLRSGQLLPRLQAATGTPIVVAPRIADVEALVTGSVQAVFYVNNSMENAQLVRTGRLTHVQLMHGDSDKVASRNPVSAMYDLVFVAGQAGIDRYRKHGVDIPERKFRIIGRPQLHRIAIGPRERGAAGPVVLYAPTWAGTSDEVNYSSLSIGSAIMTALLEHGATVLLRAHPFTRHNATAAARLTEMEQLLAADAGRSGRRHRWGAAAAEAMSLADCVNAADAAITDVSGAASDWLYSGKPLALTDVHGRGAALADQLPLARGSYLIGPDGRNTADVVGQMLGDDPLRAIRAEVRTYYLGDVPPERCVDVFLDAARECYRTAPSLAEDAAAGLRAGDSEVASEERSDVSQVAAPVDWAPIRVGGPVDAAWSPRLSPFPGGPLGSPCVTEERRCQHDPSCTWG